MIGGDEYDPNPKGTPTTKDLLASNFCLDNSQELDLDLHVPFGWEKRLDLKSGRVYLQRCNPHKHQIQDLNFPPSTSKPLLFHDSSTTTTSSLDLKLASSSPSSYESVCTLDKVKFALQRAEKEPLVSKKRDRPVAAGCPGCLSYVLIVTSSPQCPRCATLVPLPPSKKPCIDLNISI